MFSKVLSHFSENKLTKQQRHATAVLAIGTFLEYFDLYLYVHMTTFMDEIFFSSSARESWFLSNLALCSAFLFRPIGAILLGWLGDNLGRKSTIFISTTVTSICCVVTAYLPTYKEIGITSAYILTACRIAQSMLSSAEVQGARVYLIETTDGTKNQCILSGIIHCFTTVGRFAAVILANIVINRWHHSWRTVFLVGAIVALVGAYARSSLKETPEFADAKKRLKQATMELNQEVRQSHPLFKVKSNKKDVLYLFVLKCGEALSMFFVYTYCVKAFTKIGISSGEILNYSTYVSIWDAIVAFGLLLLIFGFDPLKIVKFRINALTALLALSPILFTTFKSPLIIFCAQLTMISFEISDYPASPLLYKRFPVLQRFTSVLMISALSRALIWSVGIYALPFLTDLFGHYGLYFIFIPIGLLAILAIRYFTTMQKARDTLEQNRKITVDLQNT